MLINDKGVIVDFNHFVSLITYLIYSTTCCLNLSGSELNTGNQLLDSTKLSASQKNPFLSVFAQFSLMISGYHFQWFLMVSNDDLKR